MTVQELRAPAAQRVANPYVGPYPLGRSDHLYGRDDELKELRYLLQAERIVLVHSRSGAGKSSLVEAGLLRQLDKRLFRAMNTVRVGELPTADQAAEARPNRYLYSARRALLAGAPAAHAEIAQAQPTLRGMLDSLRELAQVPTDDVLFFDQFEEVFSLDPFDRQSKQEFFEQLGDALSDRSRWAVFGMRDEYVAALEPYLTCIPGQLRARFWLEYLEPRNAVDAVVRPAEDVGLQFAQGVAAQLVERLRTVPASVSAGSSYGDLKQYPFVDPVQLQVVCHRLWTRLEAGATEITQADLDRSGNIDHTLEEFYAEQVHAVAAEYGIAEREIRNWFERSLITERHTRGQAPRHASEAAGLRLDAVRALADIHLVREGGPPDATWFELAHDRLVESVLLDNTRWRQQLQPFQRIAEQWEASGRSADLLLTGASLDASLAWAARHRSQLWGPDRAFLEAAQAARRSRRILRLILSGLAIAVAAACLAFLTALVMRQQVRTLMSRDLASTSANRDMADHPDLSLLLAAQSVALQDDPISPVTRQALLAALDARPSLRGLLRVRSGDGTERTPILSLAFGADNSHVLVTSRDGAVRTWDINQHRLVDSSVSLSGQLRSSAFVLNGSQFATGDSNGEIRVWTASADGVNSIARFSAQSSDNLALSLSNGFVAAGGKDNALSLWSVPAGTPVSLPRDQVTTADTLALDPTGPRLAYALPRPAAPTATAAARIIRVVDWATGAQNDLIVEGTGGVIGSIAFSPDGNRLAVGGEDHKIRIWNAPLAQSAPRILDGHTDAIRALAFSADGHVLASGSADRSVRLWDMDSPSPRTIVGPLELAGRATSLAFSGDGSRVASGDDGGMVTLWDTTGRPSLSEPLETGGFAVTSLGVTGDGRTLAAGGCVGINPSRGCDGGGAIVWDISGPPKRKTLLAAQAGKVQDVAWSADGRQLATVASDGTLSIADASTGATRVHVPGAHSGPILAVAFSPTAPVVATGGSDTLVKLWNSDSGAPVLDGFTAPGAVGSITYSPDGSLLAVASVDGKIRVWNTTTGQPLADPPETGLQVEFGRNGVLAYGGDDGVVRLWDPAARQVTRTLVPSGRSAVYKIQSLAFSPDGATLAATDEDNTIRIWDVDTGLSAGLFRAGAHYPSRRLVLTRNGEVIVSGSDNSLLVWDLGRDALIARACDLVGRTFDQDEWTTYVGGWRSFLGTGGWRDGVGPVVQTLAPPVSSNEKVCRGGALP